MKITTFGRKTGYGHGLWSLAFVGMALLAGCGGGGGDTEVSSPSDFEPPAEPVNIGGDAELYDPDRLINVSVTMSLPISAN